MMKRSFSGLLRFSGTPAIMLLVVAVIIEIFGTQTSMPGSFITSFLNTNTTVIAICIGEAVVIISGGIDISVGPLVSLCNVLLVQMMIAGLPMPLAIIVMLAVSIGAGALNGFVVSYMRVTPLLTTYATSIVFAGLALLVSSSPIYVNTTALTDFYNSAPFGIPMTLLFIAIPFIIWQVYRNTPAGIKIYAVGANQSKAYLSGINVAKSKMFVYSFAGFCAGIGALAMTSMVGGGDPLIGSPMAMTAIAAAVIGGASLSGGKGGITGGIFGVLFLSMLTNIIIALKVNSYWQQLYTALIMLVSVVLAVVISNRKIKIKRGSEDASKIDTANS